MANNYGVYQDGSNPVLWVKETTPDLVLSSADQAELWSEVDAMVVANYLNSGNAESVYKVGRPGDRQPH